VREKKKKQKKKEMKQKNSDEILPLVVEVF